MQEEEAVCAVSGVQVVDARCGVREDRRVFGERFLLRIREIGQQGEVQMLVTIAEEAHFEGVEERIDAGDRVGDGRHDDDGAQGLGNALAQAPVLAAAAAAPGESRSGARG